MAYMVPTAKVSKENQGILGMGAKVQDRMSESSGSLSNK